MATEKPTEYYVVWEESCDAGSLAWATRIAKKKAKANKGYVAIRQRVGITEETNGDGIAQWTYDEDVLIQDVFE